MTHGAVGILSPGRKLTQKEGGKPSGRQGILPDDTVASVGCKDDNGGDGGFQGSVQVGKALDIQHVDFIHEEHSRNQFCNALVNVFVHHLVDLPSQFI